MRLVSLQYHIYNGRAVGRQYATSSRSDPFQHQLVSSILCPAGKQSPAFPQIRCKSLQFLMGSGLDLSKKST